jgi:hypothetical protein
MLAPVEIGDPCTWLARDACTLYGFAARAASKLIWTGLDRKLPQLVEFVGIRWGVGDFPFSLEISFLQQSLTRTSMRQSNSLALWRLRSLLCFSLNLRWLRFFTPRPPFNCPISKGISECWRRSQCVSGTYQYILPDLVVSKNGP